IQHDWFPLIDWYQDGGHASDSGHGTPSPHESALSISQGREGRESMLRPPPEKLNDRPKQSDGNGLSHPVRAAKHRDSSERAGFVNGPRAQRSGALLRMNNVAGLQWGRDRSVAE